MELKTLLQLYSDKSCNRIYVKKLSPNDNSKNQIYLGGSFDVLNVLPIQEIVTEDKGSWERHRFKTKMNFSWLNGDGSAEKASDAQLILYPKYPEVRFSGFLKGVKNAPSELMTSRIDGRLLFFGITNTNEILGYVVHPESAVSKEFTEIKGLETNGVFTEVNLSSGNVEKNSKARLLEELHRIHHLGWINSKRLDTYRNILPCNSTNCGGYTLEAELGITPNGYAEPDYLGWEMKQFNVKDFSKYESSVITLMTPEPTDGYYVTEGIEKFILKYGYKDKLGREARINFGGIYKYNKANSATSLKLILEGFDTESKKITNASGFIGLLDSKDNIAASWSFSSLLKHWNRKHANACYVPSLYRKDPRLRDGSQQQYWYGNRVVLGRQTEFSFVLIEIANGNLYYDPGIKLELPIEGVRKKYIKRRSQFRIKSSNLKNLYKENEIIRILPSRS